MGRVYCCVVNCKNTSVNSDYKFYKFPKSQFRSVQRQKWINAVNRINPDESPWNPKNYEKICSSHFVGNEKSESELSPSYVPTIFPDVYKKRKVDEIAATNRYKRLIKRTFKERRSTIVNENIIPTANSAVVEDISFCVVVHQPEILRIDGECQANIFSKCSYSENTFTCNRYIYENSTFCDAEVQTEILDRNEITTVNFNHKKFKNKSSGTPVKTYVDKAVGPDCEVDNSVKNNYFAGFSSVKNDEQMSDLTGGTLNNFNFLLKTVSVSEKCKLSKENWLFIFLVKIKTALSFSAMSVLFSVHRTTISRIFFSVLEQLASTTANLIFWPAKGVIQRTMPQCFYPDYCNTRVIIDCTEFKIAVPSTLDNRVYCYSNYKKGFTAKVLIGITPSGFISFKSKVAGGRKSDSQITIESGLLDLLEDGDCVLADKGFPNISTMIDKKNKKVLVAMPPFLEKKPEFSREETEQTYNIAKVRIHVERVMQRLRVYKILDKIPEHLFEHVDDILHICCVLVNSQPPIFAENQEKQSVIEENNQ